MSRNLDDFQRIERLLGESDYRALELVLRGLGLKSLASAWLKFKPLDKLVLFKLLDAPRAMEFYEELPFKERYYLLCGFPLSSIAPVLEKLSPAERRLFVQLPREFYDRMFRQLAGERVEIDVTVSPN